MTRPQLRWAFFFKQKHFVPSSHHFKEKHKSRSTSDHSTRPDLQLGCQVNNGGGADVTSDLQTSTELVQLSVLLMVGALPRLHVGQSKVGKSDKDTTATTTTTGTTAIITRTQTLTTTMAQWGVARKV